jgi:hypothetical protein
MEYTSEEEDDEYTSEEEEVGSGPVVNEEEFEAFMAQYS